MDRFCAVTRFLAGWLGIFEVIRFLWVEAEKMQFGANVIKLMFLKKIPHIIFIIARCLFLIKNFYVLH